MGNYNPRAPYILGEEWVPIRNEGVTYSPAVNAVELGHGFSLGVARQIGQGRFYVQAPPQTNAEDQILSMAVYARGTADRTGPINAVTIPVTSAIVSGTGFSLINAASYEEALWNPGDSKRVTFTTIAAPGTDVRLRLSFGVAQYLQLLYGKRILGVNLIYNGSKANVVGTPTTALVFIDRIGLSPGLTLNYLDFEDTSGPLAAAIVRPLTRMVGGEFTEHWLTTATDERMPWTYPALVQFDWANTATPITVDLRVTIAAGDFITWQMDYAALEVIYCEEQRLAVGGSHYTSAASGLFAPVLRQGTNILTMRNLQYVINPVLPAGDYDLVLSSPDPGDSDFDLTGQTFYSVQNGSRELYTIPPHPGVQVNIPFPPFDSIGQVFTQSVTHVLPQLSLATTGQAVVTEPHVYGRQGAAQVFGAISAQQEIYDDIVGVNTTYPQVRFYARRFGDTTVPLALTGTGSLAGSAVTITPGDFDALTEIVDGWREVTLRFATPPVMGTKVSPEPSWAWSAAGELAGNRWEIMAACAPSVSGIPGNMMQNVPAGQLLGAATYQPPAGATVGLQWMPQGVASPWVSGASLDQGCDAVLMFSQDPPTVTGVALTSLTQTVTGIGLDCGSAPCCIPTGIGYQRITWSSTAASLPVTGFGAYELQRFDTAPDATWQTIMLASSPLVTGFNDYEARVGLASVYRIRVLNILNFAGPYSVQVTGTPATPGVTGGCGDNTGALIFTSNAAQSGAYNAAYVPQWDREPIEDFALPESDAVQFQPMYQRDGFVAFHGTERGLEQFTRTLLIQQGAIDPIRLADVKTLRDLAWAQLPYICVRDESGDRWFANVRVPKVDVRKNRTHYLAQIAVTELTRTAYPVDAPPL